MYIGLRQKRERGPAYDELVDELMQAATERYYISFCVFSANITNKVSCLDGGETYSFSMKISQTLMRSDC